MLFSMMFLQFIVCGIVRIVAGTAPAVLSECRGRKAYCGNEGNRTKF
jgi:hypothetical protein